MRKIEKNHGTQLTKYQHMMVQQLNEPTPSKSSIKIWPFIRIQSTHSPPSAKSWVQRPLGAIGLTVVGLRQSTVQLRRAQQRIAERSKVQLTRLVPHIRVKKNKSLFKTFNVEDVMQATIGVLYIPPGVWNHQWSELCNRQNIPLYCKIMSCVITSFDWVTRCHLPLHFSVPVHLRGGRFIRCELRECLQGLLGLCPGAGGEHGQLSGKRDQREGSGGCVQVTQHELDRHFWNENG